MYVHVPFCASRCGYCDFVTYTTGELGGTRLRDGYADAAIAELHVAARTLGADRPPVSTVFFGGGTPTMLLADDLVRVLAAVDDTLGLAPGAEVTVEANPDSVDDTSLARLRAGGFTRISFGMQSVRRHVLAVLERTHTPGGAEAAVRAARDAGFAHVNVDLIYGTPGETDDDWLAALHAAIDTGADHISAYALTVEPRTRLGAQVRHGRVPAPDSDVQARRYEMADDVLSAAGFAWYELSNWARDASARCAHNLLYWRNDNWWGVGPGAHSHVGGTRWWNVRHPAAHAERVQRGEAPVEGSERCTPEERALEDLMLGIRLADGVDVHALAHTASIDDTVAQVDALVADGLVEPDAWRRQRRIVLTRSGRLVADSVVLRLQPDASRDRAGCVASPTAP